jgi:hypothetical protein
MGGQMKALLVVTYVDGSQNAFEGGKESIENRCQLERPFAESYSVFVKAGGSWVCMRRNGPWVDGEPSSLDVLFEVDTNLSMR